MQTPTPAAAGQPASPFKFQLADRLIIAASGEAGEVQGRSEYATSEPHYLLRYKAADGRATEAWWSQSALETCPGLSVAQVEHAEHAEAVKDFFHEGLIVPAIGTWWHGQGGVYAGVARGVGDAPDYRLILSQFKPDKELGWQAAMDWAGALQISGNADWSLPTRAESALLFANLRDEFEPRWYWTSEQYSRDGAWSQDFVGGYQYYYVKTITGRARAVRRLVIQSFSHS